MLKFILASSILSFSIIGAGMFSLPFIVSKAGWLTGLIYLIIFAGAFSLVHLMYADIILRTKEKFLFIGYAEKYLGKWAYWASVLAVILGIFLVLTVYLILSVSFLNLLGPWFANLDVNFKIILFWLLGSGAMFLNIERLAASKFFAAILMSLIIVAIFIFGLTGWEKFSNIPAINWNNIFLPFGPILFALAGWSAIPPVIDYFKEEKMPTKAMTVVILSGSIFPVFIYLLFIFGILGSSSIITNDAVSGLFNLPQIFLSIIGILGLIVIWGPYVINGFTLREALNFDLKMNNFWAGVLVAGVPLAIYFAGFNNFLMLEGVVGGIFLALESLIIILIWRKMSSLAVPPMLMKWFPVWLVYPMILIFTIGAAYAIIHYK